MNYIRILGSKIGDYTKIADMSMKILAYSVDNNDLDIDWNKMKSGDKSDIIVMYNLVMTKQKGLKGNLADNFIAPPFSVLDMKQQYWVERKNIWLSKGLKGELGRDLKPGGQFRTSYGVLEKNKGSSTGGYKVNKDTAVSPFDPVLCEIAYYWFCTEKGRKILDPFAGGSSRGIVAEYIGFKYTGIELREEQIKENVKCSKLFGVNPKWIKGDSNIELDKINENFDLIFTCPPYFDLEIYSDLEGELSKLNSYEDFLERYKSILIKSISKLKNNRFICIVIENIRDKKGNILNLVGDTINIVESTGAKFYNDMVILTPIGSSPIRSAKHMKESRKVERVHQNMLVFYKGDSKSIEKEFKNIQLRKVDG